MSLNRCLNPLSFVFVDERNAVMYNKGINDFLEGIMSLSSQIRKYRKELNLTQEQLADELCVTAQAISKWERGGAPDIGMLPIIANYFQITIDELLENTAQNVNDERTALFSKLSRKPPEERIKLINVFLRKFPKDSDAMLVLIHAISQLPDDEMSLQLPKMRELCEKILSNTNDPDIRNSAVMEMCMCCPKEERGEWLSLLPENVTLRRHNIRTVLTLNDENHSDGEAEVELLMFLELSEHMKNRIPDQMGPERKRRQSVYYMKIMESLADETGELPMGWLCQYAYEQLVLSAALFALGRREEAWAQFTEAMERFHKWYGLPEDMNLPTGFDRIKVSKKHTYAFYTDTNKKEHSEFIGFSASYYCSLLPSELLRCLTEPRWAWFDSARDDPRYLSAVEWVKSMI